MVFQVTIKQSYFVMQENVDSGSKIALSNHWCIYPIYGILLVAD